ncbi:MAG TPA: protein kinase [Thermoanaerobaculia bacterium]|nr:protein kinase [Thermoanaerobaculia bacterium]
MTLTAGSRLGQYEILSPLGAGGMGEVYRARDPRLGRDVAIKVLPEQLFEDEDRVARFEREAKSLAALNHTGIATIYSFEEAAGRHLLSMELVEGDGLDTRIAAGPIPVDEALAIARQIAEALESAHEKGIVHRDLKPANVKVTPDGKVKLLDFGLAKVFEAEGGPSSSLTHSPTLTGRATAAGVVLGTAAYMSPEQSRGKAVDKRADVWAFGCVLYEMLTGRRLFEGETVSDTLAAVLRQEIRLDQLPAGTPASVRRVLARCLERDPKQRLHDIGDARIEIEQGTSVEATSDGPLRQSRLPWVITLMLLVASAALAWLLLRRPQPSSQVLRASIAPPAGTAFWLEQNGPGPAALSPDGRQIAFTAAGEDGKVNLYVCSLETGETRALAGAEGAQYPFWSPDGLSLGFFVIGKLKTIAVAGGPALTICAAQEGKGGSWSLAGVIVFAPNSGAPIFKVSDKGGEPAQLTRLDEKRGDDSHRHPRFLPDGRHFLYLARSQTNPGEGHAILAGSIDGEPEKLLLRSPAAVQYASGRLLFLRETTLMARPFDAKRLVFTGEAVPVAERIFQPSPQVALGVYSASQNGVLVYQTARGGEAGTRLQWFGRDGKALEAISDPGGYREVALSPDGKWAAASLRDNTTGTHDLWIFDLVRGLRSRFTFDPSDDRDPVWSPDSRTIVFSSNRKGHYDLYRKALGGTSEEDVLFASDTDKFPADWSAAGGILIFNDLAKGTDLDIWELPMDGTRKPEPFLKTKFNEGAGALSPDGRWLVYFSDESGQFEVYATSFPHAGRKWQVSTAGGVYAYWSADGQEILYQRQDGTLHAVAVGARGETLDLGQAQALFHVSGPLTAGSTFWPTADHRRILAVSGGQEPAALLDLVVNWTAGLRAK